MRSTNRRIGIFLVVLAAAVLVIKKVKNMMNQRRFK